jgi:hypothetical protein
MFFRPGAIESVLMDILPNKNLGPLLTRRAVSVYQMLTGRRLSNKCLIVS